MYLKFSQVQLKRLLLSFHFLISITGNKSLEMIKSQRQWILTEHISYSVQACSETGLQAYFFQTSPFGDHRSWNGHCKKKNGLPLLPPSKKKFFLKINKTLINRRTLHFVLNGVSSVPKNMFVTLSFSKLIRLLTLCLVTSQLADWPTRRHQLADV